jgi:hypothetical protein
MVYTPQFFFITAVAKPKAATDRRTPNSMAKRAARLILCLLGTIPAFGISPSINWVPLRVVDVNKLDWGEARFGSKTKWLFEGEQGSHLLFCYFAPLGVPSPPAEIMGPHYHLFHEWGYIAGGDYVTYEFVNPAQRHGEMLHHRTGTWLDRPAYSIHGGGFGGMNRQDSCTMLIMEEGSSSQNADPIGGVITFDPKSRFYKPESKTVKQFTTPHFIHSLEALEWEPDTELPGASIKWLSDDRIGGFRGRIHFVPAGWTAKGIARSYYKRAHRFIYILFGDMNLLTHESDVSPGTPITVSKDFLIEQPPLSIWDWGKQPVSTNGCMWLEVVYAKGTIANGGPIEDASVIR